MPMRPKLKIGDVVKVTKKFKNAYKPFGLKPRHTCAMIVVDVSGDGVDGRSKIRVIERVPKNKGMRYFTFNRRDLWYTGKNVSNSMHTPKNTARFPLWSTYSISTLSPKAKRACEDLTEQKKNEIKCWRCGKGADPGVKCWSCGEMN